MAKLYDWLFKRVLQLDMSGSGPPWPLEVFNEATNTYDQLGIVGAAGLVWQGAWSNSTAYAVHDAVQDNGSAYVCIVAHTGHEPPNATYWQLLASKGDTGAAGATGATGAAGATGATGATGPAGLTWQGAWSNSTAYALHDAVSDNGSAYVCISAHTGHEPPNATYWQLLASKGDAGATGATGAAGATGATGAAGATGATGATGAHGTPVWQGNWSLSTAYAVGDAVFHNGSSWVANTATTGVEPGAPNTQWDYLAQQGATGATGAAGAAGFYTAYACIEDAKPSGTDGGTLTSGSWITRTLNTVTDDTGGHVSLSSNQLTLDAGTYRILAHVPGNSVNRHQARLYNVTGSLTLVQGTSARANVAGVSQTDSVMAGRFTIAAGQDLEIQHQVSSTMTVVGAGNSCAFGSNEIYTRVELWKE